MAADRTLEIELQGFESYFQHFLSDLGNVL